MTSLVYCARSPWGLHAWRRVWQQTTAAVLGPGTLWWICDHCGLRDPAT